MTWRNRIRLGLGLVGVLALAAVLTMIVNRNNGIVESRSASLVAEDYPVGTDYAGTVTQQYVHTGDIVKAGQPLFEVQSATLERDIAQNLVTAGNLTYEVKNDNTIVLAATNDGVVSSVAYTNGAFVPANTTIATIQQAGSMYVSADFVLSAKDYARIPAQAQVDLVLPNNEKVTAQVSQIQVQTEDGQARTIIRAYSPDLADGTGLFAVGTPVQATLHLDNSGVVTDVTNSITSAVGLGDQA